MTAQEWLRKASVALENAKITDADSDAWLMFSYVTGMSRMEYTLKRDRCLSAEEVCSLSKMLEKRKQHIPVQQITGEAWFMGYPFWVNENVLIPRMDTEVLVEAVLTRLASVPLPKNKKRRILDMCTGSGCILLSLLKETNGLLGTGADISEEALCVARQNADRLECKARFIRSDLWENIDDTYEIIVSNPPYIVRNVILTLDAEVRDHEPLLALDGGEDGLDFYRKIVADARRFLVPGGLLAFEIGYDQGQALTELLNNAGYNNIEILKDLAGLDRVALGWKADEQQEE